ncbi:hypothetical protein GL218_03298 [Daldinia childiae]|uniref:uncharacterized protein n=1 Tax=Daldinia childiae TaxID=326645 RepID=UPI0014458BDA|nr:uncharacterized protein GL218_03298 [Daldinia childiae]KAF3061950.1 hypothetical protein GL218_03298 [Daldinia childiae]
MRGYLKAQWLLAPLLTAALPTIQEVKVPHAIINLDINSTSDEINHRGTTLRLDILESTSPCGYGNVTLSGQSLAQDENGAGSGPVITENGNTILANWAFSCVHLEDEFQGQLMTFEVISLDGEEAHDVRFVVQFQQMAPPSISFINGTASITEGLTPATATDDNLVKETSTPLDSELAELKSMMRQLAALEQAISSKVQHISKTYDLKSPDEFHSFWRCDSLKFSMGMGLKEEGILVVDRIDSAGDFITAIDLTGFRMTAALIRTTLVRTRDLILTLLTPLIINLLMDLLMGLLMDLPLMGLPITNPLIFTNRLRSVIAHPHPHLHLTSFTKSTHHTLTHHQVIKF